MILEEIPLLSAYIRKKRPALCRKTLTKPASAWSAVTHKQGIPAEKQSGGTAYCPAALLFGGLAAEVYLRQYVARLLLSRLDIIFIPTTLHASLFHRCPNCSVTAKWFFSYRISPSRCMRDISLLSALRSTFR